MNLARIAANERIAQLDVLRGLAILLILYMNIQYMGDFSNPEYFPNRVSWNGFDQAAWWVNRLLDGTQRGLLELLFGAGVLIMARHAMTPDGPVAVADLHMRRNMWLMVFGIAHGVVFLWEGDILFAYGTAALLIFPFRRLRSRWLLGLGIAVNLGLLAPSMIEYRERAALATAATAAGDRLAGGERLGDADKAVLAKWGAAQAEARGIDPAIIKAEKARMKGPFAAYAAARIKAWVSVEFTEVGIYWENVIEAFGTMMIGMALFKWGIIQGRASRATFVLLLVAGYGIGLALRVPATVAQLRFDALPDIGMVTFGLARLPITLGHIGGVTLALSTGLGKIMLRPFEANGRLPLSTYMGASAAAVVLFGWPFLGLFGKLGFGQLFALATAIIVSQIIIANLWLKLFATGPLEWLWKSLSYAAPQPLRTGTEPLS
ncbi:DUF418 domain-containing protein [Sandarakinorhabdus sp. DWP1-3-1]|uniref:DUF418 domain-containing protein n=1 Tax=Sandarakinorhabdus sp. DWP1-3-1 TaxID=2804627 RepID=UPI003CEC610B